MLVVQAVQIQQLLNYDSTATIDDGSCIAIVYGCTNPAAINYFPGANVDDGSCCLVAGCTDPLHQITIHLHV